VTKNIKAKGASDLKSPSLLSIESRDFALFAYMTGENVAPLFARLRGEERSVLNGPPLMFKPGTTIAI